MKSKLTLLLPDEVVLKAKRQAKRRGTSVSAIFAQSVERMSEDEEREADILSRSPQLAEVAGAMAGVKAFDDRSAAILKKHG
jgi:hypothetical protein